MKPAEAQPPPLPPVAAVCDRRADDARRSQSAAPTAPPRSRRALQSLALLLGLMLLAWVALRYQLPLPPCPLRAMSDVPCPFCGSTRTFAALARLDFAAALRLNPLVCVGAVAAAVWLLTLWRGDDWGKRMKAAWTKGAVWKWLLAVALALNWLYLWFHLPR